MCARRTLLSLLRCACLSAQLNVLPLHSHFVHTGPTQVLLPLLAGAILLIPAASLIAGLSNPALLFSDTPWFMLHALPEWLNAALLAWPLLLGRVAMCTRGAWERHMAAAFGGGRAGGGGGGEGGGGGGKDAGSGGGGAAAAVNDAPAVTATGIGVSAV